MKLINILNENEQEVNEVNPNNSFLKLFTKSASSFDDAINKVLQFDKNNRIYSGKVKKGQVPISNSDELRLALAAGDVTSQQLGKLYSGLLKNPSTDPDTIRFLVKDLMDDTTFINKFAKYNDDKVLRAELKKSQFSDQTVKEIMKQKSLGKFGQKRTPGGSTTTTRPTSGGSVKPKGFSRIGELLKGIRSGWNWKKVLAWGAGLGLTAYGVWYLLTEYGGGVKPNDMPTEAPSDWSPCIQNMLDSGEGRKITQGDYNAVLVKNDEYPDGVYFYSNGRVMNDSTRQMGSWECVGGQTELQETKKMTLMSLVEQSNEVSGDEMSKYLNDAVDDLDGWVAVYNINSLINIVKNLKGKTYNGKDAFKEFLDLYAADEGGTNFIDDVNSVGVTSLGREGIEGKRELISLINSPSSSPAQTQSGGFEDVSITWDQQPESGGQQPSTPQRSSQTYFSCEDWDISTRPYIMGCKATKIREIQSCIGINPDGMYGPKTRTALIDMESDISKGITLELYEKIMKRCRRGGESQKPVTPPSEQPSQGTTEPSSETPTTDSVEPQFGDKSYSNTQESGEQFYMRLLNGGRLVGSTDKNRIKYKGGPLSEKDFNKLTEFLSTKGYYLMKTKEKGEENMKYVWAKSKQE